MKNSMALIHSMKYIMLFEAFAVSGDEVKPAIMDISYAFSPEVKELQDTLAQKGYDLGSFGPNLNGVDGKYGPVTRAAHQAWLDGISPEEFSKSKVQKFQKMEGEPTDSALSKEFNFHSIPDGKNNYRSAQLTESYLDWVIDKYGIKTIIRFNGDGRDARHRRTHPETSIQSERRLAESKGVRFYSLSATRNQDQVNALLSGGNVLIHCAHGADRTGGNVGGYLQSIGWGDTKKIWDYSTKYNGWNQMVKSNPTGFSNGGYLRQAQKFGVRDLNHARELAGIR